MSTKTLPILFLNLGGEMLYILDQRLRAQSIPQEKAQKGEKLQKEICLCVAFCIDISCLILHCLIVPFVYKLYQSVASKLLFYPVCLIYS